MALSIWLHIIGVALWIGPQIALIFVVLPALRGIQHPGERRAVISALTSRLNIFGWSALALLVVTGLGNLGGLLRDPATLFASPYGQTLLIKLAMVTAVILITLVHSKVVGPRLLALSSDARPDQVGRLRRASVAVSGSGLVLSLWIVWLGVRLHYGG
jgi:copper resistance protein D